MKTQINIFNLHETHTFLVKFQFQLGNSTYIVQRDGLVNCLKNCDKNGIAFIKLFDFKTNSFKRVSKKDILNFFSWDTESYIYLQKHYF